MVPDEDQAMVLPCASVMVIMVLLNVALTWATPELMFLRSRRRGLARPACCCCSLAIQWNSRRDVQMGTAAVDSRRPRCTGDHVTFFLPSNDRPGPLRVRESVFLLCPLTVMPLRWRSPR